MRESESIPLGSTSENLIAIESVSTLRREAGVVGDGGEKIREEGAGEGLLDASVTPTSGILMRPDGAWGRLPTDTLWKTECPYQIHVLLENEYSVPFYIPWRCLSTRRRGDEKYEFPKYALRRE